MKAIHFLWLFVIMTYFLAACQPALETSSYEEVRQKNKSTVTQHSFATNTPSVTDSPDQTQPPSNPITTTTTPQLTSTTMQICSPLAEHGLEELVEIVSQPYHPPPTGKDDRHHGIDFAYYRHGGRASIEGESVQAMLPGRITAAIEDRLPYGNMIIIETSQQYMSPEMITALDMPTDTSLYHLYAHLKTTPTFELGQEIACGEIIGAVGQTGYLIPVPHLHIETRIGPPGARFESMAYYDTQATEDEMELYRLWRTSGAFEHFDPMILFEVFLSIDPSNENQP